MGTIPCPSCGVAVAIGYPKCPRCHAAVPSARARRSTFREQNVLGGTSIEPPERTSGGSGALIAVGILVVLLGGGLIWYLGRGGEKSAPPPAQPAPSEEDDVATPSPDDEVAPPSGAASASAATRPTSPAGDDGAAALRQLDDELRTARMWAKVSRDGAAVLIESSACDDAEMKPAIAKLGNALRGGGFAKVRCQEPNGHVDFENAL